jgi:hypothetical protein
MHIDAYQEVADQWRQLTGQCFCAPDGSELVLIEHVPVALRVCVQTSLFRAVCDLGSHLHPQLERVLLTLNYFDDPEIPGRFSLERQSGHVIYEIDYPVGKDFSLRGHIERIERCISEAQTRLPPTALPGETT